MSEIKWVLGSASPRRKELLTALGIDFEVRITEIDEVYPDTLKKREVATYLSELKAEAGKSKLSDNEVLICADTIVLLNNEILGKPTDRSDAIRMLSSLSGAKHEVITGICFLNKNKKILDSSSTFVYFKHITQEEIEYYVDTFKPYDKAGAYGIQEWIGYMAIERIEGTYANVMGLPTHLVIELMDLFKL